jgi:signal transduction histidine kinase
VLVNIASNAVKYSPPGGTIKFAASIKDKAVEVRIQDEGRGVPKEMQEAIFNRFQQVQDIDSTQMNGTGLGLAICKAIVELHGGTIVVESPQDAVGSIFIFTIPLHEKALANISEASDSH